MRRIICIGNRYVTGDNVGPRVFDFLTGGSLLPRDVEVHDGGLAGLDLLSLIEGAERIVFVDQVKGFAASKSESIVALRAEDVLQRAAPKKHFGHASGVPFLLACAPEACEPPPKEMLLVGVEGDSIDDHTIAEAARTSLRIAASAL